MTLFVYLNLFSVHMSFEFHIIYILTRWKYLIYKLYLYFHVIHSIVLCDSYLLYNYFKTITGSCGSRVFFPAVFGHSSYYRFLCWCEVKAVYIVTVIVENWIVHFLAPSPRFNVEQLFLRMFYFFNLHMS